MAKVIANPPNISLIVAGRIELVVDLLDYLLFDVFLSLPIPAINSWKLYK